MVVARARKVTLFRAGAVGVVLLLLAGALWTVVGGLGAWSSKPEPAEVAQPAPAPEAVSAGAEALYAGPLRQPRPLDVGFAYGLPAGHLVVDVSKARAVAESAQYLARHGQLGQAQPPPAEAPRLSDVAADPFLPLSPIDRSAFLWRHESATPADAAAGRVLSLFARLLESEQTLQSELRDDFPGGPAGYAKLLSRDAKGEALNPDERTVLQAFIDGHGVVAAARDVLALRTQTDAAAHALKPLVAGRGLAEASGLPALPRPDLTPDTLRESLAAEALDGRTDRLTDLLDAASERAGLFLPRAKPVESSDFVGAVRAYAAARSYPLSDSDALRLEEYAATLDPGQTRFLASIILAAAETERLVGQAMDRLRPQDRDVLREAIDDVLGSSGDPAAASRAAAALASLEGRFDARPLWSAALTLTATVEAAAAQYRQPQQNGGSPFFFFPEDGPSDLEGLIVVGTAKGETYDRDAALAFDFGGDDLYKVAIGGGKNLGGIVTDPEVATGGFDDGLVHLFVDLAGDDLYAPFLGFDGTALGGSNLAGVGLAFEFSGDDTYSPEQGNGLGTGIGGLGLFVDYEGDDTYAASSMVGSLGNGVIGVGIALDRAGDDSYDALNGLGYGVLGFAEFRDVTGDDSYDVDQGLGVGLEGFGYAHEVSGNDSYVVRAGLGRGNLGAATFLDSAGSDSYVGGAGAEPDPADDTVWVYLGTQPFIFTEVVVVPLVSVFGVGADEASLAVVPGLDLQVRFQQPPSRFRAAPGGVFDLWVAVDNRGTQTAQNASVTVEVVPRDDDPAGEPLMFEPRTVHFDPIPAGSSATKPVRIQAPNATSDEPRHLHAVAELVASHDADPTNDADTHDFSLERVADVRIDGLAASESGRVVPESATPLRLQLTNRGNVDITVPLRIVVAGAEEATADYFEVLFEQDVFIPSNSDIYDVTLPFTTQWVDATWNVPPTRGAYNLSASIPSTPEVNGACQDPESPACVARTTRLVSLHAEQLVDARVTAHQLQPITDPDFFEGFPFRVLNAGTDPLEGQLNMTARRFPFGPTVTTQAFLSIDPDQSQIVVMQRPTPRPAADEVWSFSATAWVPAEDASKRFDNSASFQVKFKSGVIFVDDFEQDNPSLGPRIATPCSSGEDTPWQRGTPTYFGQHSSLEGAFSGAAVWATNLDGPVCDGTRYDLVFHDLDLTGVLPPVRLEFMSAIDSEGSPGQAASSGGYVAVAPTGSQEFLPAASAPEFACPDGDPWPFSDEGGMPLMCGTRSWTKYSLDLSQYAGQRVDVRFRYLAYGCCVNSYRAGWMIDDLSLSASRRLDGDVELMEIRPEPWPLLAGEPGLLNLVVRNNGYAPVDVTARVRVTLGTTSTEVPLPDGDLASLAGGETGVIALPFTPPAAKRYLLQRVDADSTNLPDPRPSNNRILNRPLDVYGFVAGSDLEELAACPPSCFDWSEGRSPEATTPVGWQAGEPQDYPGGAASGNVSWATDLDGPYQQGQASTDVPFCCYGTARSYQLSTPAWTIPGADAVEGDKYVLAFRHAYWLGRQLSGDTSGYENQNDLAYVVARSPDRPAALLKPEGGYPESSTYGYCFVYPDFESECGDPPFNVNLQGWAGKSAGYQEAFLPVPGAEVGSEYTFDFYLWSHYRADLLDEPRPGWTVDDVALLRTPRFDYDLSLGSISPTVFNASSQNLLTVGVRNEGRKAYEPDRMPDATVTVTLFPPDQDPLEYVVKVPELEHGGETVVTVPFQAPPGFFGSIDAVVDLEWTKDEWNLNDAPPPQALRLVWLFHNADFERSPGPYKASGSLGLVHGVPSAAHAPGGQRSWYTDSLSGSRQGALTGPRLWLQTPDGIRLREMRMEGSLYFDGGDRGLVCPYNGFRLVDYTTNEYLRIPPGDFVDLTYWGETAQCGSHLPQDFSIDLTPRQDERPDFQPRFEFFSAYYDWCVCFLEPSNKGVQVDDVTVYGLPYDLNLQLHSFLSPGSIVGPGEEALVNVRVVNGGLGWPEGSLGVEVRSNDGPKPSLNKILPLRSLEFAETEDLAVRWDIPSTLDGETLQLTARLLVNRGSGWEALVDEFAADNRLEHSVSVLSIHDLALDVRASPSLEPDEVAPILVKVSMTNRGTRTEKPVRLNLRVLDEQGTVAYELASQGSSTLPPAYASAGKKIEFAWTPPAPGHYRAVASLEYPDAAQDANPSDNSDTAWIHSNAMSYRFGDDFDGTSATWKAEGGQLSALGFGPAYSPEAPAGDFVLRTNAAQASYEPDARYRYDFSVDLAGASSPRLTLRTSYSLGEGDVARVLASTDGGATWNVLAPLGGYGPSAEGYVGDSAGWRAAAFDLTTSSQRPVLLRFELLSDRAGQGPGWSIDDVAVVSDGGTLTRQGFEHPLGAVEQRWDFEEGSEGWEKQTDIGSEDFNDWAVGVPTHGPSGAHSGQKVWKTNLAGPYSTALTGHKILKTPSIAVPEGKESVRFGWHQFYEMQYGQFPWEPEPQTEMTDGVVVRVSVDDGPAEPVTPDNGYPQPLDPSFMGSSRGFAGVSGGWQFQSIDLTPYAGHTVRVVFDFAVPYGDDNYAFYREFEYITGPRTGMVLDDAAVYARDAVPGNEGSLNARVDAIDLPLVPAFQPATASATLYNEGDARPVQVSWSWVGPRGRILDSGVETISLAAGASPYIIDLDPQDELLAAVLRVKVDASGDDQPWDDERIVPAAVQDVVLDVGFEASQGFGEGCGLVSPCNGWEHEGLGDEWHHAAFPPGKVPTLPHSGSLAFATDLINTPPDENLNYEFDTDQILRSTTFTVPPAGGALKFWHAMDAPPYDPWYYDGGQVYANGELIEPVGGYTPARSYQGNDCYIPIYDPCYTGTFDWTQAEFDLDAYQGQDVQLEFRFRSDPWLNVGHGWAIDDLSVVGRQEPPQLDAALLSPEKVSFDPRYPFEFQATLVNEGLTSTPLLRLSADYYRDGRPLTSFSRTVPTLAPETRTAVTLPVPDGSLQGLSVRLSLTTPAGGAPDDNPMNDVAFTEFQAFESLFQANFEDGRALPQSPLHPPGERFVVAAPGANIPPPPSQRFLAAGLGFGRLAQSTRCGAYSIAGSTGCGFLALPTMTVPVGGVLEFDYFHKFSGSRDGWLIEYSRNGGYTWFPLDPVGGYNLIRCGGGINPYFQRCFSGNPDRWQHAEFSLADLAGEAAQIRLVYYRNAGTPFDAGLAIDNLVVRGIGIPEAVTGEPRFERGFLQNPKGPLEAASFPNAWGSGLKSSTVRPRGWDVLESPSFDLSRVPDPRLSFDYFLSPEEGGAVSVQVADAAGNWVEVDRLSDPTALWERADYTLAGLGDATRVRFVLSNLRPQAEFAGAGFFVDNVLVGSLSGSLERTDQATVAQYVVTDGQVLDVPVRLTNTGAFTNEYRFSARGPTPEWLGIGVPETVRLEPGQSRLATVKVEVPVGGEAASFDVLVVAQSLFDALQLTTLRVPIRLDVSERPDWQVHDLGLMIQTNTGDGNWTVQDAQPNHITMTVVNHGLLDSEQRPRVVFYEHLESGDRRAFNTSYLEELQDGSDLDTPVPVNVSWMPRKDVIGLEVVVNPGNEIPESSRVNNSAFHGLNVQPRPLPELGLANEPGFSKEPHLDEPTTVGLNVKNSGGSPTDFAVDVAMLAGYQDAFLTSPPVNLKGNDLLKLRFVADLETRVDAVVMEARSRDGPWVGLTPIGGYPYGCILAVECQDGISGNTGGRPRELTFELGSLRGPTEFRARFALDSHNGRTYDGFLLQRVTIKHFKETLRDFDFARGAGGWSAAGSHSWTYRSADGAASGAWSIPRDYQNPYTVGLKQVPQGGVCPPCLEAGALGFAEVEWTPTMPDGTAVAGTFDLLVYVDPHDLQPEFLSDFNRFLYRVNVLSSGFTVEPQEPIVLPNASAQRTVGLVLRNSGNHASTFQFTVRQGPHFAAAITRAARPVDEVLLDVGQSLVVDLNIRATGAPSGTHSLYLDVLDTATGKLFLFGVPIRVDSGTIMPRLSEAEGFTVRQKAMQTLLVQNPGNSFINVVLRATDKPAGLATRITPDEFTLAPFEARSVEFEFLNLGAKPGPYKVAVINAAVVCAVALDECNRFATLTVNVLPYAPPTASIKLDTNSARLGQPVRFQDASSATGSAIATWRWDFGDGVTSLESAPVHAYTRPGIYEVTLRVTDAEGQASLSPPVLVAVVNSEPVTVARVAAPAIPMAGRPVNFTAFDSSDLDGGIQQVTWAFGDGTLGHGVNVTHTYRQAGTYKVTVAVEDGFGAVSVQVLVVEVLPGETAQVKSTDDNPKGTPGLGVAALLLALLGSSMVPRRRRFD